MLIIVVLYLIFLGVIAYVDVRSGTNSTINTGQSIAESLMTLGASVRLL